MGRPITRDIKLKRGFYIEVKSKGSNKGIMIRRDSYDQIQMAIQKYEGMYSVHYHGEVTTGKV